MTTTAEPRASVDLSEHGIQPAGVVYRNLSTSQLYEHALARGEARLAEGGPLAVDTGKHTGRSPKDKFVVREPGSEDRIWFGDVNAEIAESRFDALREKVTAYLSEREGLYVVDAFAGADPSHRLNVRVVTDRPYHALFAKTMFIEPEDGELAGFEAQAVVLHAPALEADPETDGTRSGTFVVLHPTRTEVLIGGTFYAGEIKKSIFTVMNDRLPLEGVLPMHCSANVDDGGRVAIFFGLSGTGKTTLSADPERHLIGDDEHGWGDGGVFNFEGGCYAKVIRLSAEAEPEIYRTTRTFGTILENFQTSQYDEPIAFEGHLDVELDDGTVYRVEIERAHMEEDTGKSLHVGGSTGRIHGATHSLVDYNRAGIPLIEIVTKPMTGAGERAPEIARAYVATLRDLLKALDVSDVRMEQGSMRCDVNLSLMRKDADGARHALGDQERQLAALGRAGRALRGRPPRGGPDVRRHDRAGDPALARGHRCHDLGPGEVGRRRLPLLPRARPRAGRPVARVASTRCAARSPSRRSPAASGCRPTGASPTSRCATSSTPGSSSSSRRPSPRAPRRRPRASGGRARSPGAPTPRARTCRRTPRGWAWARHPSSSSRAS